MASDLCKVLEYKNGRDTINRLFSNSVAKYYAGVETGKKAKRSMEWSIEDIQKKISKTLQKVF